MGCIGVILGLSPKFSLTQQAICDGKTSIANGTSFCKCVGYITFTRPIGTIPSHLHGYQRSPSLPNIRKGLLKVTFPPALQCTLIKLIALFQKL